MAEPLFGRESHNSKPTSIQLVGHYGDAITARPLLASLQKRGLTSVFGRLDAMDAFFDETFLIIFVNRIYRPAKPYSFPY